MTQIDRINGLIGSIAVKVPCRVATTANITLSGEQTIDGVAAVADDRILVKNQTTTSENGIYDVSATSWTRTTDFNGTRDFTKGTTVRIIEGTLNIGVNFEVITSGTNVGVSTISFAAVPHPLVSDVFHVVATKTAAEALTPVDGQKVFITSADGGEFTMRTGASATTYDDNGGAACGTQFTAGDGSSGFERNFNGSYFVGWFNAVADDSTDNTAAVHLARDAAFDAGGGTIEFGLGIYKGNFVLRKWVHWIGQGKGTVLKAYDGTAATLRNPLTADGDDSPPHLNRWSVKKMLIDGDHSSDTVNNIVYAFDLSPENDSWIDQGIIEHIHFDNCGKGFRAHGIETGAASNPSFIQKLSMRNVRFAAAASTQSTQFNIKGVILESNFDIFINYDGATDPAYIIEASAGSPINTPSRCTWSNLVVDKGSATGNCGQITAGRNLTFNGLYHESSNNSINMNTTDELVNVNFYNPRFNDYVGHAVIGNKIDGCNFHNPEFLSGTTANANEAVDFSGGSLADVNNVTFTGSVRHSEHAGILVNLPNGLPSLANEATPALDTGDKYYLSANATEITGLDNAIENHVYTLMRTGGSNAQYIDNTANFANLPAPFYPRTNGDSISLMLIGTVWKETGRAQTAKNLTYTTTGANQTINVSGYASVAFNQGSASSIDDFAGVVSEYDGAELLVYAANGNTTINHGSGINTNTGANVTLTAGVGYKAISRGGTWYLL